MRKKKPKPKTIEQKRREHCKRRFRQRFYIDVTSKDLGELVKEIQSNKLKFLRRSNMNVTLWEKVIGGVLAIVVYSKSVKQVLTVYRKEKKHDRKETSGD